MKNLRNKPGFTLIEVLTVMIIIGILAAIAIPNFLSYRDREEGITQEQVAQEQVATKRSVADMSDKEWKAHCKILQARLKEKYKNKKSATKQIYMEECGLLDKEKLTLNDLKEIEGEIVKLQGDIMKKRFSVMIMSSKGCEKTYSISPNLYALLRLRARGGDYSLPVFNLKKENNLIG